MEKFELLKNKTFVIGEAGINHNGKLSLALKLVDKAKEAGVTAVKFQTFKAEALDSRKAKVKIFKKLELSKQDFIKLKKYCDKKGLIFLSTPHSPEAIGFLEPLVPCYKIGSADLTNIPFLEKVASKKKPIILSTGMASLSEIRKVVRAIKKQRNTKIILLQCTTCYPCPLEEVNLQAITTLKKEFGLPVGLSDHTLSTVVPALAVALGAQVIEKHFTLARTLPGPDHAASLTPEELKQMVKAIREAEKALGSPLKKPTKNESKIKKLVRKSIVAKMALAKGTVLKKEMLTIKRPGTGIEPKDLDKVIGKKTKRGLGRDELIKLSDLN